MVAAATDPSPLDEALESSNSVWQKHLKSSFGHAKHRFGDVILEVHESIGKERDFNKDPVEIWAHKGRLNNKKLQPSKHLLPQLSYMHECLLGIGIYIFLEKREMVHHLFLTRRCQLLCQIPNGEKNLLQRIPNHSTLPMHHVSFALLCLISTRSPSLEFSVVCTRRIKDQRLRKGTLYLK